MPVAEATSSSGKPRASVLLAAAFAGIVACGGGDGTRPAGPNASELPIVYAYGVGGRTAPRDLYLTSVDGNTTVRLPDLGGDEAFPAWRPGGRELLVTQTAATTKLLLVDEEGSNVRTVPAVNSAARWSPDGAWIVFANTGSIFLEVMRLDGTSRRWITSAVGGPRMEHPSWSPTDRVVYTLGEDGGGHAIQVQQVNQPFGGNLTQGPDDQWPAWSPDGGTVAFSMGLRHPNGTAFREIGLVNADGSNRRRLTLESNGVKLAPVWSPDGRWLLFEDWDYSMSTCSLVRIPATGGSPVTIVPARTGGVCGGASWR